MQERLPWQEDLEESAWDYIVTVSVRHLLSPPRDHGDGKARWLIGPLLERLLTLSFDQHLKKHHALFKLVPRGPLQYGHMEDRRSRNRLTAW